MSFVSLLRSLVCLDDTHTSRYILLRQAYVRAGRCFVILGELEKAVEQFSLAIEKGDTSSDTKEYDKNVKSLLSTKQAAFDAFEKVLVEWCTPMFGERCRVSLF